MLCGVEILEQRLTITNLNDFCFANIYVWFQIAALFLVDKKSAVEREGRGEGGGSGGGVWEPGGREAW